MISGIRVTASSPPLFHGACHALALATLRLARGLRAGEAQARWCGEDINTAEQFRRHRSQQHLRSVSPAILFLKPDIRTGFSQQALQHP